MRRLLAAALVVIAVPILSVTVHQLLAAGPMCGHFTVQGCDNDEDGVISILDIANVAKFYGDSVGTSTPTAVPTATSTAVPTATSTATPNTGNSVDLIVADNYGHATDGCVAGAGGYDWAQSAVARAWSPRGTFNASWAMVEWDCAHDSGSPGMQFEVRDFKMYAYFANGTWQLIDSGIYGSQLQDPCFGGPGCTPYHGPDPGAGPIFNAPPHGTAIQFYQPHRDILLGIVGMFATYRARLVADDGAAFLMLNTGADWCCTKEGWPLGDMGVGRLKRLTGAFQWFNMTTLDEATLRAHPPPL